MRDELEYETGLDSMTKAELKAEARSRGLPTTGTKAALLERVEEHDRADSGGNGGGEESAPAGNDRAATEAPGGNGSEGGGESAEAEGHEPEARESEEGGEPEETEDRDEAEPPAAEGEGETEPPEPRQRQTTDGDAGAQGGKPERGSPREERGDGSRAGIADVASTAARALAELTGRTIDAVSGVRKGDDGHHVTIEVLELSRVPSTTDVLATYEVVVGDDGSIVEYSRAHRYYRNQTSRE